MKSLCYLVDEASSYSSSKQDKPKSVLYPYKDITEKELLSLYFNFKDAENAEGSTAKDTCYSLKCESQSKDATIKPIS